MAEKGKFNEEEAGSLFENNLIVFVGTPVLEQAFEQSLRFTLDFNSDWKVYAFRTVFIFIAYNAVKFYTLLRRDQNGWTSVRKFGAWLYRVLIGG